MYTWIYLEHRNTQNTTQRGTTMKRTQKQAADKFELITDKIIKLMESGVKPWVKPWHSVPYGNLLTGRAYRGINPLICTVDMLTNNWDHPYFIGYHQATEKGWIIKKGSKSTWLRWGGLAAKDVELEDGSTEKKFFQCSKWLSVFNVACVDDSQSDRKVADYIKSLTGNNTDPRSVPVEDFVAAQRATIKHVGNAACYSPANDAIAMPEYESFTSSDTYYATLIHELTHWTGHSSRLDRDLSGSFGSQKYAFEELIAELGAAFSCNALGIESTIEHHASYLDNWLQVLKSDNKAFFKAASAAQKASTFLLTNAGLIESYESNESDSEAA